MMPQFDAGEQSANVEITVTPLVNWLWLGFGVMALGTLIALLPETAFAFAAARVPEGAKTATASLLLLVDRPARGCAGAGRHVGPCEQDGAAA